jgi:hypothetical protein
MSDIEQKVFNLILEASYAKRGVLFDQCKLRDIPDIVHDALVYSIEQHEATQQEYSDFRHLVSGAISADVDKQISAKVLPQFRANSVRFIIPKPKPDPLVEVMKELVLTARMTSGDLRAALEVRGLEIRSKNDG